CPLVRPHTTCRSWNNTASIPGRVIDQVGLSDRPPCGVPVRLIGHTGRPRLRPADRSGAPYLRRGKGPHVPVTPGLTPPTTGAPRDRSADPSLDAPSASGQSVCQSQSNPPPDWYSITRVSKKFFSFCRSMTSDIHGN